MICSDDSISRPSWYIFLVGGTKQEMISNGFWSSVAWPQKWKSMWISKGSFEAHVSSAVVRQRQSNNSQAETRVMTFTLRSVHTPQCKIRTSRIEQQPGKCWKVSSRSPIMKPNSKYEEINVYAIINIY